MGKYNNVLKDAKFDVAQVGTKLKLLRPVNTHIFSVSIGWFVKKELHRADKFMNGVNITLATTCF